MGFRATGNEQAISSLSPAHRRAIMAAGESVEDDSLRYWAPSSRARDIAEIMNVAYRAEPETLCMILTTFGRSVHRMLSEQAAPDQPA